jgi:hypothetical protein
MKRLAFSFVVLLAWFVFPLWIPKAYACICLVIPDIAGAVSGADVVFSGRVASSDRFMAHFEVEKNWKGQERSRITMLTGARDMGNGTIRVASCDFSYVAGQRYVVYAAGAPNALIAAGCSRTAILSDSEVKGPKQSTVTVPVNGCIEASLFLIRPLQQS